MDRLILVSGDSHAGPEPEVFRDYIDPAFRERIDELAVEQAQFMRLSTISKENIPAETLDVIDTDGAIRSGGEYGAWDLARRLQEMDREGIAAEVALAGTQLAIQPFFSVVNKPYPPALRAAGAKAWHRWMADLMRESDGRIVGIAEPGPCLDLAETRRELEWCRENGFVSVAPPCNTGDASLPPLYDRYYEPFWAACADLGLVLCAHAGWGHQQGKFWEFAAQFTELVVGADTNATTSGRARMMEALSAAADSPLALDMGPRRLIWQLMLGGVFDRYPDLKLVLAEVRADWLPATLATLDARAAKGDTGLALKPSEYWRRNCAATPSSVHACEMAMRYDIGVENFLFGRDFPHPESTWPNSLEWIRATFTDVPEDEARLILGENAIRIFGLDRDRLAGIAAEIGPRPQDVLGRYEIDPRYIAHFHHRAGFSRPAETVVPTYVVSLFDEDLAAVGGAR